MAECRSAAQPAGARPVELGEGDPARELAGEGLDHGADAATGAAPRGPAVDHEVGVGHRQGLASWPVAVSTAAAAIAEILCRETPASAVPVGERVRDRPWRWACGPDIYGCWHYLQMVHGQLYPRGTAHISPRSEVG